ncbi:MAG TPA: GNAT family N-acetyltransferase [Sporichthyaceae bacterium]|nr:GNAT family N-acetyltransferase [Sporichthyaceae bacterium]
MTSCDLPPEPVEISAGRIQLRPWEERLAAELLEACRDPDLGRLPGGPPAATLEGARAWIGGRAQAWQRGAQLAFAVQEPTTAVLLGGFDLRELVEDEARLVGWVAPGARRRGIATAAAATLTRWGFGALGLERIRLDHVVGDAVACAFARRSGFAVGPPDLTGNTCPTGHHLRSSDDPAP